MPVSHTIFSVEIYANYMVYKQ